MKCIRVAHMFDGKEQIEDACLMIEQDHIVYAGEQAKAPKFLIEEDINYGEATMIPGIIDCHVHVNGYTPPLTCDHMAEMSAIGAMRLQMLSKQGVSCIRDVGSAGKIAYALKELVAQGVLLGPKMFVSGPTLNITGGHGYEIGEACDGVEEFKKATRQHLVDGADWIKVMMGGHDNVPEPFAWEVEPEELEVVVKEAYKKGKKVCVHAQGYTACKISIECGVKSIEHGVFLDDDLLLQMKEKEISLVPTLSPPRGGNGKRKPPEGKEAEKRANASSILEVHNENVRKAYRMGINVAMGTDNGVFFDDFTDAYSDMRYLQEIGIHPVDILKMSTINGAKLLDVTDLYGTLQEGRKADFIVLEKNPAEDILHMYSNKVVYKDGNIITDTLSMKNGVIA